MENETIFSSKKLRERDKIIQQKHEEEIRGYKITLEKQKFNNSELRKSLFNYKNQTDRLVKCLGFPDLMDAQVFIDEVDEQGRAVTYKDCQVQSAELTQKLEEEQRKVRELEERNASLERRDREREEENVALKRALAAKESEREDESKRADGRYWFVESHLISSHIFTVLLPIAFLLKSTEISKANTKTSSRRATLLLRDSTRIGRNGRTSRNGSSVPPKFVSMPRRRKRSARRRKPIACS